MSIMFMGFSVVIYSTHTNWKAKAEGLQAQVKEAQTKAQQLEDRKNKEIEQLNTAVSERAREIASLTTKAEELAKENKTFKDELTQLNEKKEEGIAAVKLSHESQASLRGEVEGLRKDLRGAQEDWAKQYSTLVAKTDEAHNLALQLANYKSVGERLAEDYRDAVDVLKKNGLKPVPELYNGIPPKGIQGIITEVRPNGWVEISVGSDSGLVKGQQLDVIRNYGDRSSYIGKIEIIQTEADRSAAKVKPEFRRGTVQRDDSVLFIDTNELSAK
ncbi:MAG: hypothetical protein LBN39_05505 [Planctomycetaceae bacterium]|nr:hypothetical protein [Planctomycetaceae bacterium]